MVSWVCVVGACVFVSEQTQALYVYLSCMSQREHPLLQSLNTVVGLCVCHPSVDSYVMWPVKLLVNFRTAIVSVCLSVTQKWLSIGTIIAREIPLNANHLYRVFSLQVAFTVGPVFIFRPFSKQACSVVLFVDYCVACIIFVDTVLCVYAALVKVLFGECVNQCAKFFCSDRSIYLLI